MAAREEPAASGPDRRAARRRLSCPRPGAGGGPDGSCRESGDSPAALDLGDVLDVGGILLVAARPTAEPGVEDLGKLRLGGCPEAEGKGVGVVPSTRALGGLGVQA